MMGRVCSRQQDSSLVKFPFRRDFPKQEVVRGTNEPSLVGRSQVSSVGREDKRCASFLLIEIGYRSTKQSSRGQVVKAYEPASRGNSFPIRRESNDPGFSVMNQQQRFRSSLVIRLFFRRPFVLCNVCRRWICTCPARQAQYCQANAAS